jgi:hypothetical protein
VFKNITAGKSGGAINLYSTSANVMIINCQFNNITVTLETAVGINIYDQKTTRTLDDWTSNFTGVIIIIIIIIVVVVVIIVFMVNDFCYIFFFFCQRLLLLLLLFVVFVVNDFYYFFFFFCYFYLFFSRAQTVWKTALRLILTLI